MAKKPVVDKAPITPASQANVTLDQARDMFEAVVICGLDSEGNIKILTSPDSSMVAHWILSRSQFELNLFEKTMQTKKMQADSK